MSQQARISLSTKDVIHIEGFQGTASVFKNDSTVRIRAILQQLQDALVQSGMNVSEINALMEQGIPCEVLQPSAPDWQVGALRLSLDFQPGAIVASSLSSSPVASTLDVQSISDVEAPIAMAVEATMPDAEPAIDLMMNLDEDLGSDLELELPDDLSDDDLGDDLGELSIEGLGKEALDAETLGEDAFDMSGFGAESDLDIGESLSGIGDLDGFDIMGDDALSVDLSLGLDSQAVMTDNLDDLSNPWDLSGDLDDMLLQSSHS